MKRNNTLFARIRNGKASKFLAAFLAINLLIELCAPSVAMALTAGAAAPEFSSFEPVATTDMVNEFTGDFTYNLPVLSVPGPDGGGYSMSLSYHSGASSEEEASWVGFGWTLNPGSINRQKRGYADDFKNVEVKNYNKVKPSWMQTATFSLNVEALSKDQKEDNKKEKKKHDDQKSKSKSERKLGTKTGDGDSDSGGSDPATVSVSLSHTIRYNNYTGFSVANGFGVTVMGMASVNMNRAGGQNTYGVSVNPMNILRFMEKKSKQKQLENAKAVLPEGSDQLKQAEKIINNKKTLSKKISGSQARRLIQSSYGIPNYNLPPLSYSVAEHAGIAWNFSGSVQLNINIPVGFQFGVAGSFSMDANKGDNTNYAFGYMYPGENNASKTDVLEDFSIEKESTFEKHDKNLGIPFNNADVFAATGNGVVGGFKFIHDKIGQNYPTKTKSVKKMRQLGVELGVGLTFQVGFDIGIGKQTTEVNGDWDKGITYPDFPEAQFFSTYPAVQQHYLTAKGNSNLTLSDYIANSASPQDKTAYYDFQSTPLKFSASPKPKMRFTNDPGGELRYSKGYSDNDVQFASLGQQKNLDLHNFDQSLDKDKATSSSFVDYTKDGNLIKTISITGKDGGTSEYGQPVFVRNETQLSIGVENKDGSFLTYAPLNCKDPMSNETVTGQDIKEKYASIFLLTANKTFDYYDADKIAGPSDGDFGGWTKFSYRKAFGKTDADWYRYRAPYNGLTYNPGRVSDIHDQTGSMSSGEKEVYYSKSVETKTHVAFFITNKTTAADFAEYNIPSTSEEYVTGSGSERFDGIDAKAIDAGGMDQAANDPTAQGTHHAEKLERIVVFSKSDFSKPLTTTFFEYDYSLCQGVLNNSKFKSATADPTEKGKMTLKRVWMESGGTIKSKISPYQFSYEYFNKYPTEITQKYSDWAPAYNLLKTNDANQNPFYKPEELDPWGCYQELGAEKFSKRQEWVSQKAPSATFDPAAWQLKRIQLPSGGEIHVNYEQKDYKYVQDRKPMAMISLLPQTFSQEEGYKADNTLFYINTADMTEITDKDAYVAELKRYFLEEKNKLYYKVLYAYVGFDNPQLNAQNPRFDYVTGYTTVNDVGIDNNKIFLRLGDKTKNNTNGYDGDKDKTLPRYVGYQNLLSNAGQNLGLNAKNYQNADPLYTSIAYPIGTSPSINQISNDITDMARQHVFHNTVDMFKDWVGGLIKNVKKKDACRIMNEELSYFKLPVLVTKKGGGVRVKRLISYDPGIAGETGGAMVYGSEYIYEDEHGYTSGVATNEPAAAREENALVGFIERKKQKGIDRALNGRDMKEFEGPIGETILPNASIVHERVVVRNIHSGKTTTGYMVNTYHTCHEYPMYATNSVLAKSNNTYKKFDLSLPLGLFNMDIHRAWVTQGYLFIQNDMNGKIASQATYPGNYTMSNFKDAVATTRTEYTYSVPGSTINTLIYDPANGQMRQSQLSPGTEEDFTMFQAHVHEKTNDFSVELDLNLSYFPPSCSLGFGLSYSFSESQLSQHVTSKVVSQTSYLLATTTTTDGITQTTENLAFDKNTGDPVLTRTYDGYQAPTEKMFTKNDKNAAGDKIRHEGYYYSLAIPASWIYSEMGPKSSKTDGKTNQLAASAGSIITYGKNEMYDDLSTNNVWSSITHPLTNVVSASASVYQNNWFTNIVASDYPLLNNLSTGEFNTLKTELNKHLYPYRSYVYQDDVKNANDNNVKMYGGGIMVHPFEFMNWGILNNGDNIDATHHDEAGSVYFDPQMGKWFSPTAVVSYSPNGYSLEEKDVLGIRSTAKFGYGNTLPILMAQNAKNAEVLFTDFELRNGFSGTTIDMNVTSEFAHSGQSSYNLTTNHDYNLASSYPVSTEMITKNGLGIKLWLRSAFNGANNVGLKNQNPQLKVLIGGQSFNCKKIAETGEWALYGVDIKTFNGLLPGNYDIRLSYNYNTGLNEKVLIDDVRVQPLNATMNCTVYTVDSKVAAQFDDQHFGVFYEYNQKGMLVRKSIETERGKKTLQEQQYNTPEVPRNKQL